MRLHQISMLWLLKDVTLTVRSAEAQPDRSGLSDCTDGFSVSFKQRWQWGHNSHLPDKPLSNRCLKTKDYRCTICEWTSENIWCVVYIFIATLLRVNNDKIK